MRGGFDPEDLDWTDDTPTMSRWHMLAADVFGYSYAHYAEHLDTGKDRYTTLMPNDVRLLARAQQEGWDPKRIAGTLEIPKENIEAWQGAYQEAQDIVDAPTPAQSFRRGVRQSIQDAIDQGPDDEAAVESLVTQIA